MLLNESRWRINYAICNPEIIVSAKSFNIFLFFKPFGWNNVMGILECRILQTVKRFFWNQYTDFLLRKEQRLDIDACRVWFYQILKKVRKDISLFLYTVVPTSIYETTLLWLHTKSKRNVCHLIIGFLAANFSLRYL